MSEFLASNRRSHSCGALRASDAGTHAVLTGWVQTYRDHGGCVFIDLRDREGVTQLVFDPSFAPVAHELARDLRNEWCIGVRGEVRSRGGNVNDRMPTGAVEVWVSQLEVFSRADTPPFAIEDEVETNEALRLKYRYLDLRRPKLQRNLIMRSAITRTTRDYLGKNGFLEIETPFMVKYTPGGARNFLVPSRLNPGAFYALAESPQIFKQLLMVAGYERYFQIVRCFRDEDLRLDRQPEFTQIDLELSFVNEEILQGVMEGLIAALWKEVLGIELTLPLRRMTYAEAMDKYGVDKPDLRLDLVLCDVTAPCGKSGFRVFEGVVAGGGIVKCLRIPDGDKLSRSQLDGLTDFAKQFGVKGVAFARVLEGGTWQAPFAKSFSDEARIEANRIAGAGPGDVLIFVAEKAKIANTCMGAIRLHLGDKLGLIRRGEYQFMWLTDPPLFEIDEDGTVAAAHHPFTSPRAQDEALLESAPGQVLARAYDLVLNGVEVGGGSIRIHRSDLQARIFKALGITDEDARRKFGFLLDAFKFGPPPHGGIAFGLDRLSMLMTGAESLRDVIAFPKTQKGSDLMTECPTGVSKKQLDELFIQLRPDLPQ
ncbi:MAG: aspartate--tRNA ligase [Kofleriaceae bacterium]|jgi:aspartyl-tRNA synthetase|nr:aspartate--tRNA ligase [Kofleriaceae bacterium]MBP6836105.1 aspartate--tRNA ligase [Kofleriaceae bacterium]MBP9203176.1 aspartate--tRNA ligase [Kofleriaceae bacterium]